MSPIEVALIGALSGIAGSALVELVKFILARRGAAPARRRVLEPVLPITADVERLEDTLKAPPPDRPPRGATPPRDFGEASRAMAPAAVLESDPILGDPASLADTQASGWLATGRWAYVALAVLVTLGAIFLFLALQATLGR